MEKYNHQEIEGKWQQRWVEANAFSAKNGGRGTYILDMFPYPSGDGLHVGHPEGYTATDIYSRYLRMNGAKVLHPMGWDAFGLPAENYAIKMGVHPADVTAKNIANFKRQIQSLGFSYDWDREVNTTDPAYYKWTQWIFLQLFKRGLAYEKEAPIWWCPKDKTGLANEEVVNGKCDRCGTAVEKKMLKQWMLRITAYADRLLDGLNDVDWPEGIKTLQRNWIGKSEGAEVKFEIAETLKQVQSDKLVVTVFTTRPDTLFGATYLVLSPEHELVKQITTDKQKKDVEKYVKSVAAKSDLERTSLEKEKTGVFTGAYAINPVNNEKIPVWIADYVLSSYGTGAIMAVPAHDKRDWEFAKKNNLPIKFVYVAPIIKALQSLKQQAPKYYPSASDFHNNIKAATFVKNCIYLLKYYRQFNDPSDISTDQWEEIAKKSALAAHEEDVSMNLPKATVENEIKYAFIAWSGYHEKMDKLIKDSIEAKIPQEEFLQILKDKEWEYLTDVIIEDRVFDEFIKDGWSSLYDSERLMELINEPFISEEGVVINSDTLNGLSFKKAKRKIIANESQNLIKQGGIVGITNYKLRDWVFSRQRYWGEPIPLVHCEHCKQQVESTPNYLNFYSRVIWENLTSGRKTIETRALNPEEPDRYFGNIVAGHENNSFIKGVFKPTGETAYFRVKHVTKYKSLGELFNDKEAMKAVAPTKIFASLKELETAYEKLAPGYVEKIKKNGLIAFEVKHIIPGVLPLKDAELPLELPKVKKYEPTGTGESPLAGIDAWVNVKCRICGHDAKRETNTMPQWAGSCWYYLRYCDPKNEKEFASAEALKSWLPVDMYVGGAEHAVLHLLYARFWHKVLFDAGFIPKEVGDEPFRKLKNQGLILGPDGEKMSKSRGNVINPDEIVEKYGADTLRMYEMFMGPFEDAKPWDTNGILGVRRFLEKVWRIGNDLDQNPERGKMTWAFTAKRVTEGIENFRFNTCVSDFMKWVNTFDAKTKVPKKDFEGFLKLLYPFAPHISEELWSILGHDSLLAFEKWPKYDPKDIIQEKVTIAIQVMGKLRGTLSMPAGVAQEEVEIAAKAEANVVKYLTSEPKKVIFVKDKLINFVV